MPGFELQVPTGKNAAKVDLKQGQTYTIYCTIPGHRAAGMQADDHGRSAGRQARAGHPEPDPDHGARRRTSTSTTVPAGRERPGVAVEHRRIMSMKVSIHRSSRDRVRRGRGRMAEASSGSSSYKEPTGPPVATLNVESGNVFFKPTTLTAPAGIVKMTLKNIESGTHDLVIRNVPGFQLEVSGDGSTATEKVKLKKGKYEFYCTIPGHEEAGMKGTLTVS